MWSINTKICIKYSKEVCFPPVVLSLTCMVSRELAQPLRCYTTYLPQNPSSTMFDLDTFIHVVGHVLIAVCIEDLQDWWHSTYATSLIVPLFMRFQLSWLDFSICQTFPAIMEILIHCISSTIMEIMILCNLHHGDSDLCILYVVMTTYVISCIMPIHGHCTLMYPELLYVFVFICRFVLLYYADWVAGLPFGIIHHSTSGMDLQCISAIVWPL